MKLQAGQLQHHLKQQFLPVYFVAGKEPLLIQEACDALRQHAKQQGFERRRFTLLPGFNWSDIIGATQNLSLFASKQFIDIHIPNGKIDAASGKALLHVMEQLDDTVHLLMHMNSWDSSVQKSAWFKKIQAIGAVMTIWPLEDKQLPQWLQQRAKSRQLSLSPAACALLAERVSHHLLAAAQAVDKLVLRYGPGNISDAQVDALISDEARFDVFQLMDVVLAGNAAQLYKTVERLKQEGVEPILMLWALAKDIRLLSKLATITAQHEPTEPFFQQARIWGPRRQTLSRAAKRYNTGQWLELLRQAQGLDALIKGQRMGNIWDELLQLGLQVQNPQ